MNPPTITPRTLKAAGNPMYDWEATAERLFIESQKLETELAAERAIVSRIWVQLGSPTYADLKGRSIYDLIDEIKTDRAEAKQEAAHYMSIAQKATDELAAATKRIADCEFLLAHRYKIIERQEPRCKEAIARAEKAEAEVARLKDNAFHAAMKP